MTDQTCQKMRDFPSGQSLCAASRRPHAFVKAAGWACLAVCGLPIAVSAQELSPDSRQSGVQSSDAAYRANDFTVPQTRLRPIGAPSAVDQYRNPPAGNRSDNASNTGVRQAAWMQSSDASSVPPPSLPSGGFSLPPSSALPAPLSTNPSMGGITVPPTNLYDNAPLPRGNAANGNTAMPLPSPPIRTTTPLNPNVSTIPQAGTLAPVPRSGAIAGQSVPGGDYAPMPQPQLDNQFATLGNCRNISAPSGYRSDRILTCGQPNAYVTPVSNSVPIYSPPPAQIGPPVILPPTQMGVPIGSSQTVIPGPAGYRPLISFGQERYPVQIGQGIFGQPVAYVPGQTFRNALRYIAW